MGTIEQKFNYTFEAKEEIKQATNALGGDLTDNSELKDYAEALRGVYNDMPKVTGEGTEVTLTPTRKGRLALIPKGNSTQESTTGKNLVPMSLFDSMSSYGTANTYNDNIITLTENASSVTTLGGRYRVYINAEIGKTYTVSFDIKGTAGKTVACGFDRNKTDITLTSTFERYSSTYTIPVNAGNADKAISFYFKGGVSGDYFQFANVQVEESSTATSYEQYTGRNTSTFS